MSRVHAFLTHVTPAALSALRLRIFVFLVLDYAPEPLTTTQSKSPLRQMELWQQAQIQARCAEGARRPAGPGTGRKHAARRSQSVAVWLRRDSVNNSGSFPKCDVTDFSIDVLHPPTHTWVCV